MLAVNDAALITPDGVMAGGAPACSMSNERPAMMSVAERAGPLLAATVYFRAALPEPDAGGANETHAAALNAAQ